jgi:hypothetical protein
VEQQQIVLRKVLDPLGAAMFFDIGRACVEAEADPADLADDEARAARIAAAQGEIDILGDEVDRAVGEHDVEAHARVALEERADGEGQRVAREFERRGEADFARQHAALGRARRLGVDQRVDRARDGVEIGLAFGRQRQLPRRALEQLRAEPHFERLDAGADRRLGQPHPPRRRREPARPHHLDKDPSLIEVHRPPR